MGYSIFAKSLLSVIKVVLFSSVNWSLFLLKKKSKIYPTNEGWHFRQYKAHNYNWEASLELDWLHKRTGFTARQIKSSSIAACEGCCLSSFATYSLKNSLSEALSSTQDKARNAWWQTFLPRSIVMLGSISTRQNLRLCFHLSIEVFFA